MELFNGKDKLLTCAPFLRRSEEVEDNCVRFYISLACTDSQSTELTDSDKLNHLLTDATALAPDESQTYVIEFDSYILYQVRNESYVWGEDASEITEGTFFLQLKHSPLLELLPKISCCQTYEDGTSYPSKWTHFRICCQNHIIDAISQYPPTVHKL